uniref:Putative SugE protein n=1 Tax=uncultured marine Nitrospinaceae bacterium TaxID=482920 RepID=A4GJ31_9BACT|nr:putative SugE protein [uncultured marine Nitrospinaceae bacterium]
MADDWSSHFFYSEFFFAKAIHTTLLGTAYAVWTRIGVFGTTVAGIYLFNGPLSLFQGC